ncbi:MAG: prolipoprotein diacylglyceryl transferase [Chlamydiae bacterium]|nr:prolipoprotein diacylglyceryl transferase [Chlamydiota bacterium]
MLSFILQTIKFCEFGLTTTLPNRPSSSPYPLGAGTGRSVSLLSIWICLAESKLTKLNGSHYIYWDPSPIFFTVPFLNFPILWYGLFFALGFWLAFLLIVRLLTRYLELSSPKKEDLKKKAHLIADRLTVYVIIGTIVGARLGHFLFYESPSTYLSDPMEIFRFRNGGLASHGAMIGILVAVWIFSIRKKHATYNLSWLRLLDFIVVVTPLAGCFIRIGNFFNQEILGTQTTLPWGVVFGHPADGSFPIPRHPVQLYEAIGYLAIFFFLWRLSYIPSILLAKGKLLGLFLILVFTYRFFIEFLKVEQSDLLSTHITMGALLSIPAVLLGLFFYWRAKPCE